MPARSLAVVLIALAMACSARRDTPAGDGGATPPPDLEGRIARIGDGTIALDTKQETPIAVRGSTRISTARGEHVAPGDLVVGMRAKVWLDHKAAGPLNVAAEIVIASKDPNADWP